MELWADRGSRGTGISEVADRAGIGHPGLLHHFGTKDNLRLAVVRERDHQDLRRFETLFEPGGLDAIRALPEVARAAEERPGLAKLYLVMVMENLDPGARCTIGSSIGCGAPVGCWRRSSRSGSAAAKSVPTSTAS